jgi:pimeloyl-ACP methyl ester carboxylesterase
MALIYCIPGMGTDKRIFSELIPRLNWQGEIQILEHLPVLHANETLAEYALRLRATLPETWAEPPILLGMSMGGIIANELTKHIPYQKLLLISTIKQKSEVPIYFRALNRIPIHKILPSGVPTGLKRKFAGWFGLKLGANLDLVLQMMEDIGKAHLEWGRNAAISWAAPEQAPARAIHIHGDKDHLFPPRLVKPDHWIRGGTHNLILDEAQELADILNKYITIP